MNEILEILCDLHPDVDFTVEENLFDDGILDSFDIVTLISEISDTLEVDIPAGEITPENFNSAQAICELVERLGE